MYKCLIESCLPVKAEAALTLTKFIIESDETKQKLIPVLQNILQAFLFLMQQLNTEELFGSF